MERLDTGLENALKDANVTEANDVVRKNKSRRTDSAGRSRPGKVTTCRHWRTLTEKTAAGKVSHHTHPTYTH